MAIHLARLGYNVACLDVSPVFIEDARIRASRYRVAERFRAIVGDVRRLDEVIDGEVYDAVYMIWTTILGYYIDKRVDMEILAKARRVTSNSGILAILSTTNRDMIVARRSIMGGDMPYISEFGDYMVIEYPRFDPLKSIITNRWVFYTRRGRNLEYLDEFEFKIRIYTASEIIEIAENAGWRFEAAYHSLEDFSEYRPGHSPLNMVFRAA